MPKQRRKRGVVLTEVGLQRLRQAIHQAEIADLESPHYTLEALSDRIGLDPKTIAKILEGDVGLDKGSLERCFQAFDLNLASTDYHHPVVSTQVCQTHWGDAVDTSMFFGRTTELATLSQWLLVDRCRLVALLGFGGVGKTTLSVKLAKQMAQDADPPFDWVIWRSLRHGPPLSALLLDLLQVLSPDGAPGPLVNEPLLSTQLLERLKHQRCLLVFDNWETVLRSGAGHHRSIAGLPHPQYQGYRDCLQQWAEVAHNSTIVLTSREKPAEIAALEGMNLPVRSLSLSGLTLDATLQLLRIKGLCLEERVGDRLRQRYDGNPLGLKLVATAIADVFAGDVGAFLSTDVAVFDGLRLLFDQQMQRLSELEEQVLYWLAIYREPVSWLALRSVLLDLPDGTPLLETLASLRRRSLCVSIPGQPPRFTLQPVVMEYVTTQLVASMTTALQLQEASSSSAVVNRYALCLNTVPDHIRAVQRQVLVQPLVHALLRPGEQPDTLAAKLRQRLQQLQQDGSRRPGYHVGNLLHCLQQLQADLSGLDLSGLCLWQADLQVQPLHHVNLSQTDLRQTQFAKAFFAITAIAMGADKGPPPTSARFATAHFEGQLLVWDAQGQILTGFQANRSNLWSVTFHPQDHCVASGGDDGYIRLWDLALGYPCQTLNHGAAIHGLAFLNQGQQLISGGDDGQVRIWDLATGDCTHWQAHEQTVWAIALNRDQTILATASDDGTVKLWTLAGRCLRRLKGHQDWVRCLAFSPTQPLLATGGCDQTIRLWDMEGHCVQEIEHHRSAVFALTFTADGQQLFSGSGDQTIACFDVAAGQLQRTFTGHPSSIYALALAPDTEQLVSGGDDAQLRIWSLSTGAALRTMETWIEGITAIAPLPHHLATASTDGIVRLWTLASGSSQTLGGHRDRLYGLAASPDGSTVASASADHTVRLWSVAEAGCQRLLTAHTANVPTVAFHPTEPLLATGSWDCTIRIWHLATGQVVQTLTDHFVQSVAFSPDGTMLAVGSFDADLKLWDWRPHPPKLIRRFTGHRKWAWFTTFSPDGQWLASAGGRSHLSDLGGRHGPLLPGVDWPYRLGNGA